MTRKGKQDRHRRNLPPSQGEILWGQVTREYTDADLERAFIEDEKAKWFGVLSKKVKNKAGESVVESQHIVGTLRLRDLINQSLNINSNPSTQFPSIVSFVGGTGSGKSLLIKYLISLGIADAENSRPLTREDVRKPVCGKPASFRPTTGGVNLYADPFTLGTASPLFIADCEGIGGKAPIANDYQGILQRCAQKSFSIRSLGSKKQLDGIKTIYPRLLYIFSDVICYVTKGNEWPSTVKLLMDWSTTGAQHAINQATLPALILVVNNGTEGRKEWVAEDGQVMFAQDFLEEMRSLFETPGLEGLAKKYGITVDDSPEVNPLKQLFLKSYSSVHFHFVPRKGVGTLGTPDIIYNQIVKLKQTIETESKRVQETRKKSWTKFNGIQLISIVDHAFYHIIQNPEKPFDFGFCRQFTMQSAHTPFTRFLQVCFDRTAANDDRSRVFEPITGFLASAIVRNAQQNKNQVVVDLHVFHNRIETLCKTAVSEFLENYVTCSYVHREDRPRSRSWTCSNTRSGHTKGHQNGLGFFSADGDYEDGITKIYSEDKLVTSIKTRIDELLGEAKLKSAGFDPYSWREVVEAKHKANIKTLRGIGAYPTATVGDNSDDDAELTLLKNMINTRELIPKALVTVVKEPPFLKAKFCFCCLFRTSEYRLPCQHLVCEACLKDYSSTILSREPKCSVVLEECMICGDNARLNNDHIWPFVVPILPELTNPRVLSLDGAGVRAITQLVLLERLEALIGLGLPIGFFFDLIVGSSISGIVALGIGIQGLHASEYSRRFKELCTKAFVPRFGTKTVGLQWLATWWWESIYAQESYEEAVEKHLENAHLSMFGLESHCRVAVTTTAMLDCRLIANYDIGDDGNYMNSMIPLSTAAKCTSAAPLYLAPVLDLGVECRDGGLKANNPVQLAVDEARHLWDKARPPLVLSIGSGRSSHPQLEPTGSVNGNKSMEDLFTTWLKSMNGDQAWEDFYNSGNSDGDMIARCNRLNVNFLQGTSEPAFDDVDRIGEMASDARKFDEKYVQRTHLVYEPIYGPCDTSTLNAQAGILKASLYFFHPHRIFRRMQNGPVIKGSLKCRLGPFEMTPFEKLLNTTSYFMVNRHRVDMDRQRQTPNQLFEIPITFEYIPGSGPIRIDVNFGDPYSIAISGFPMDLQVLRDYYRENWIEEENLEVGDADGELADVDDDADGELADVDDDADGELADVDDDADGELADVGTGRNQPQQSTSSDGNDLTADSFEIITVTSSNTSGP
ncbi:hypothetical protein TWF730_000383 [Orbilia blumenaviensis]|uniref:PNPLA domain-containing protein n=1 Tax=Orbilia blumenaviensis TaxID=1796055 RepID=A0AAV9VNE6_9PEZI